MQDKLTMPKAGVIGFTKSVALEVLVIFVVML
jgi:hypothetical protein